MKMLRLKTQWKGVSAVIGRRRDSDETINQLYNPDMSKWWKEKKEMKEVDSFIHRRTKPTVSTEHKREQNSVNSYGWTKYSSLFCLQFHTFSWSFYFGWRSADGIICSIAAITGDDERVKEKQAINKRNMMKVKSKWGSWGATLRRYNNTFSEWPAGNWF